MRTYAVAILALTGPGYLFSQAPPAASVTQTPLATASIRGVVKNSEGTPLRGVNVSLEPIGLSATLSRIMPLLRATKTSLVTGEKGEFVLEKLPAAYYTLAANLKGYVAGRVENLKVSNDEMKENVTLVLLRQGAIQGTVLGKDGEPLPNILVTLYQRVFRKGHWRLELVAPQRSATSRADGSYSIGELDPGRYYVGTSINRTTNPTFVNTYFPSVNAANLALSINVEADYQKRGIDITLRSAPMFALTGKVVTERAFQGSVNLIPAADNPSIPERSTQSSVVAKDGTFKIVNVLPGSYILEYADDAKGRRRPAVATKASDPLPAEPLMGGRMSLLMPNEDREVSLPIGPAVSINGTVKRTAQGNALPVVLNTLDGVTVARSQPQDDKFRLDDVPPGEYFVRMEQSQGYISSLRFGGTEVLGRSIIVGLGGAGPIEMEINGNGGTLNGAVRNATGDPVPSPLFSVWNLIGSSNGVRYSAQGGPTGNTITTNLPPGEYYVAAWEGLSRSTGVSDAIEFLNQFTGDAKRVKIEPGSRIQVDIPLIPKLQVEAAMDRLP